MAYDVSRLRTQFQKSGVVVVTMKAEGLEAGDLDVLVEAIENTIPELTITDVTFEEKD